MGRKRLEGDSAKLDTWKKACYERDDYKCVWKHCEATTVHHIIKRSIIEFRYDVDNGVSVSAEAHAYFEDYPKIGMLLLRNIIGNERMNRLRKKFYEIYKYDYFARYFSDPIDLIL